MSDPTTADNEDEESDDDTDLGILPVAGGDDHLGDPHTSMTTSPNHHRLEEHNTDPTDGQSSPQHNNKPDSIAESDLPINDETEIEFQAKDVLLEASDPLGEHLDDSLQTSIIASMRSRSVLSLVPERVEYDSSLQHFLESVHIAMPARPERIRAMQLFAKERLAEQQRIAEQQLLQQQSQQLAAAIPPALDPEDPPVRRIAPSICESKHKHKAKIKPIPPTMAQPSPLTRWKSAPVNLERRDREIQVLRRQLCNDEASQRVAAWVDKRQQLHNRKFEKLTVVNKTVFPGLTTPNGGGGGDDDDDEPATFVPMLIERERLVLPTLESGVMANALNSQNSASQPWFVSHRIPKGHHEWNCVSPALPPIHRPKRKNG